MDLPFSLGPGDNYKITGTPPLKARSSEKISALHQKNDFGRSTSHKENVDPLAKTTYISGSSSKGSHNGRQTLGDAHARVESDESVQLGVARPQPAGNPTRSTRFTKNPTQPPTGASDAKLGRLDQAAQIGLPMDSAGNGTYQSFVLPDMQNLTELVSGVRQDGTPLFSRSSKPRSRFATPSQSRRKSSGRHSHIAIESVPIPADEKALYLSLQLLQEKVASLEKEKAESERRRDDYELEVLQLKSKLEEQEMFQRDSGLGSDAEDAKVRDWHGERSGKSCMHYKMANTNAIVQNSNDRFGCWNKGLKERTRRPR